MSKRIVIPVVLALLTGTASAGGIEVSLKVDPKCEPNPKQPCDMLATVISGTAPPPVDKISLVQTDNKKTPEIVLNASDLKTYVQGDDSLGVAVVFETQHLWLGNDTWWEPPRDMRTKTEGVYKALTGALDKLNVAGPAGSKAVLIAYGQGAQVKWSGDLKDLTGDKIGSQKELTATAVPVSDANPTGLSPVVGMDVAPGVDEAISALNKMGMSRKLLVVIGDGNGADALGDYKKKLQSDEIMVFAIGLQAAQDLPGDSNGWKKIAGNNAKWLDAPDGLGAALGAIADAVADRYYLRFPGADVKLKKTFDWDEKGHTFLFRGIDKKDVEVNDEIVLAPKWTPPWMVKKKSGLWWKILLGIVGAFVLLLVAVKVLGKKKQPAPEPVVVAAPPPVAAPAPAPAGPMKTVMIGIGGDDQGFPVVGWIVPLNGPNQFQTFKLQGGATKIGTGGASHIVINDGFMSTEHAQIVASPAGFVLVDGGSTNGTLVNDRRVDKHELVDNDTFLMGKTNFRFKSIN